MKIWSLTYERVEDLRNQLESKEEELETLKATAPEEVREFSLCV